MPTIVDSDFGPIDIDEGKLIDVSDGAAIFEPAIRGTDSANNPVILLAISGRALLIVNDEGRLSWGDVDRVQLDWRYNLTTERWEDTHGRSMESSD